MPTEFRFLRVLFTSEGRGKPEIDRQIAAVFALLWMLYQSVVVKIELRIKAKNPIYQVVYLPIVTHGHKLWVNGLILI